MKRRDNNPVPNLPVQQPVNPQQKFMDEYLVLCRKHGVQLAFNPQWKLSTDTGTYSMVIQVVLAEYKEQPPQG